MMKSLFLICLTLIVAGCSNHSDKSLVLNDGEKWVVNPEMMVHLRNAEQAVDTYYTEGSAGHQALAGELQENINLLISSCTMKGKAHDELHKWLLPYIKLVKALSKSEETAEASVLVEKIRDSFLEFNHYFE
ncbi:MAG: hypothetical protein GY751_00825 [Bacteroidetes bacterium]|nr:hypothetical protein [Bacteroidota bacterium]